MGILPWYTATSRYYGGVCMVRYVHGFADMERYDVLYVFDSIPDRDECRTFCSGSSLENRDIITICNGTVSEAFAGIADETNNELIATYSMHDQEHPLLVTDRVRRDVPLKQVRTVGGILSAFMKTVYRKQIKAAVKGGWGEMIGCLGDMDLLSIGTNRLARDIDGMVLGRMAFSVGQAVALLEGREFYMKSDILKAYPVLAPYLDGNSAVPLSGLDDMLHAYADSLSCMGYREESGMVVFEGHQGRYDVMAGITAV